METKSKIIKTAKVCHIISKVLYIFSCAACVVFIALAIALSCTHAIKAFTAAETAIIFSTLALYAFVCIGLLWNVAGLFKSIVDVKAPFDEKVNKYLKKIAVFVLLLAVVPALVGSILIRAICPETNVVFPISIGGIVAGVVTLLIGIFFNYGKELQKSEDETL